MIVFFLFEKCIFIFVLLLEKIVGLFFFNKVIRFFRFCFVVVSFFGFKFIFLIKVLFFLRSGVRVEFEGWFGLAVKSFWVLFVKWLSFVFFFVNFFWLFRVLWVFVNLLRWLFIWFWVLVLWFFNICLAVLIVFKKVFFIFGEVKL